MRNPDSIIGQGAGKRLGWAVFYYCSLTNEWNLYSCAETYHDAQAALARIRRLSNLDVKVEQIHTEFDQASYHRKPPGAYARRPWLAKEQCELCPPRWSPPHLTGLHNSPLARAVPYDWGDK